jgi:serine/threonine protein kinase
VQHQSGERGAYTTLTEVGSGASSTVYRTYSSRFGQDIAVKVYRWSVEDAERREMFDVGFRGVYGATGHPNILPLLDGGFTTERHPFLVMPYADGGSFAYRVETLGPRPIEEVLRVGVDIADALAATHSRGVLHRDVTPGSILLHGDGVVGLTGFALTLFGPAAPAPTSTAGFAAPEALTDYRTAGPAADVYALGATLYALLTGHPPIQRRRDENGLQFLLRAVSEAIQPLPESVPWPVTEVIHACLSKHPGLRPGSALEVRRALQRAAELSGISVPMRINPGPLPPTPPEGNTRLEVLEGAPPATVTPPPARVPTIPEVRVERPTSRRERLAAGAGVLLLAAGALSALVVSGVIDPGGGADQAESHIAQTGSSAGDEAANAAPEPDDEGGGSPTSPTSSACGQPQSVDGRTLQKCRMRTDLTPVYASAEGGVYSDPVGNIGKTTGYFAGQAEKSLFTVGDQKTRWWAYVRADNSQWGWVPILFLSDPPKKGKYPGLAECRPGACE